MKDAIHQRPIPDSAPYRTAAWVGLVWVWLRFREHLCVPLDAVISLTGRATSLLFVKPKRSINLSKAGSDVHHSTVSVEQKRTKTR
jgi:hypothetical protein